MTTDRPFKLSDDEFWSSPSKSLSRLAGERVLSEVTGIVADSPRVVVVKQREQWPYLILQTGDTLSLHKVPFALHAIVTAYSPQEGKLYAARAIAQMAPVGVEPEPSPGFSSEVKNVDLRARLSIPWRPAHYLVTTFIRDQVSNRVAVDLVTSLGTYADQEVQKFLAEQDARRPPSPIVPALGDARIIHARTVAESVPAEPGVTLRVDRIVESTGGAKALLRCSFRLPVRPSDIVTTAASELSQQGITAVVPISLLVVGSDDALPETVSLTVPSFQPLGSHGGHTFATGQFTVDLAQMGSFLQRPQTYFIYAFADRSMTPAAIMAVVAPRVR